jgi:hypothetical protein
MKIYYSNDEIVKSDDNLVSPKADMSMAYLPPEPLSRNIPEKLKLSNYVRCPAFTDTIKNTYALKFPFSFKIGVDQSTGEIQSDNPDLVKTYFIPPTDKSGVLQLQLGTLFFADQPCLASQIHPYLHNNSLTQNANVLQGEYDIGKWIRPINLAFIINSTKKEVVYEFKRGDVYSYLRLHTDQKINMYEFGNTEDIQQIVSRCLSLKFAKSQGNMPLKEVYDSFLRKKYNKKLIQLVEENKIGEI